MGGIVFIDIPSRTTVASITYALFVSRRTGLTLRRLRTRHVVCGPSEFRPVVCVRRLIRRDLVNAGAPAVICGSRSRFVRPEVIALDSDHGEYYYLIFVFHPEISIIPRPLDPRRQNFIAISRDVFGTFIVAGTATPERAYKLNELSNRFEICPTLHPSPGQRRVSLRARPSAAQQC